MTTRRLTKVEKLIKQLTVRLTTCSLEDFGDIQAELFRLQAKQVAK